MPDRGIPRSSQRVTRKSRIAMGAGWVIPVLMQSLLSLARPWNPRSAGVASR